ncbi:MAG: HEPN domain-containing protein [Deltaproteobacteria bacterium]|nr:HEPN domain-containing protein [Deltaproteobacteria bacterium]
MPDRTKIADEWFEKGRHDIEGARLLLERGHFTDTIAMLIQQALEKYLKGYLISHGWKLQKIHDLMPLLAEASKFNPVLQGGLCPPVRFLQIFLVGTAHPTILTKKSADELKKLYTEREREPDMTEPGKWMPKETKYL